MVAVMIMQSARFMYLRPGNLFKDFVVCKHIEKLNKAGRPVATFEKTQTVIRGCFTECDSHEVQQWRQLNHEITHKLVQAGEKQAVQGDYLVREDKVYLIEEIAPLSELGVSTIYYLSERNDAK